MKTLKKYKHQKKGGKPIDSGSYGCVFKPALKCKGKTRKKGVSKLMMEKYAMNEVNLLEPIYTLFTLYPDMKNYVLIPTIQDICIPDRFTNSDLNSFDTVCNRLYSYGYKRSNINSKLSDLRLLFMEDGGITVEQYIQGLHKQQIFHVIKGLRDIYKKVIIPMNDNRLFHSDIKDNNILVKNNSLKLIDFGLMIQHDPSTIHPRFLQHSYHHLIPYSILLFHDMVPFQWNVFYNTHYNLPKQQFIEKCTFHIIDAYRTFQALQSESSREIYGQRHIKELCAILFPNENWLYLISKELAYCYYNFKQEDGLFDMLTFYNTAFIYLIDVWGLSSILVTLLERLIFIKYNRTFIESIKQILKKYMFGMKDYPFDIKENFEKDIGKLTTLIKTSKNKKSNKKKHSSKQ
jgi:serine/threonine protein kinase